MEVNRTTIFCYIVHRTGRPSGSHKMAGQKQFSNYFQAVQGENYMDKSVNVNVIKRSGEEVPFDVTKIINAIKKALSAQ